MTHFRTALFLVTIAVLAATAGCGSQAETPPVEAGPALESIPADSQQDPERTVEAFLAHVTKLHGIIAADETAEPFLAAIDSSDMGSSSRLQEAGVAFWERRGLAPPVHIFGNEHFGRTSCTIFLFMPFEEYRIVSTELRDTSATVKTELMPSDEAVFNTFAMQRDIPAVRDKTGPMKVNFALSKTDAGWTITQTAGDLDKVLMVHLAITR